MMGFPVTAWNTHKAINLDVPVSYSDDTEDIHALAQNALNNSYQLPQGMPLSRRVIELDVVEHSFDILDNILNHPLIFLTMKSMPYCSMGNTPLPP
jgi:hypothetical protein